MADNHDALLARAEKGTGVDIIDDLAAALRESQAATDTLREVLHLWMGGWRPHFDLWIWGWDPTETKPITPAHRAVLSEMNPKVDGGGDG